MFVDEIAIPRTRSRRRTLPPIEQAAALYEDRVPALPPIRERLAALGDRVAELTASVAALRSRLDQLTAAGRRDR